MLESMPTQFAPAERAIQEALIEQIALFEGEVTATRLLEGVPVAFVILNAYRQIVYANDTFAQIAQVEDVSTIYGARPGEVLACVHATETEGGCGTTIFCSKCGAVKAILNGLSGNIDIQDCHVMAKHGAAYDLRVWTKPLPRDGQDYVMFAVQDIHDEVQRQVMERLFFHDVLNAVSIISGVMELATMDMGDEPPLDLNDFKDELHTAVQRIVDEIQVQRQIMAAESNTLVLNIVTLQVQQFISKLVNALQRLKFSQGLTLKLIEGPEVSMATDSALLGRVITNLVKNAVEASSPGDVVTVSYTVETDAIIFNVHNRKAMPKSVQLQVFKRSFSTKGKGRGLGTYSIKLLTEQYLGGKVWFESSEALGTTFYVSFPLAGPTA